MSLATSLLRFALHGAPEFRPGQTVTVKHCCAGMHQVDIGLSSYSLDFPLLPGDGLTYTGPFLRTHEMVTVSMEQAHGFLARFDNQSKRTKAQSYLNRLEQDFAGSVRGVHLLLAKGVLERRVDT